MKKYELYVPQNLNNGDAVTGETISQIESVMEAMFGGFTHNPAPQRGVYVNPEGRRYVDTVHVYTLFADTEAQIESLATYVCWTLDQECVSVVYPNGDAKFVQPVIAGTLSAVAA